MSSAIRADGLYLKRVLAAALRAISHTKNKHLSRSVIVWLPVEENKWLSWLFLAVCWFIICHVLQDKELYSDLGADYFD